MKILEEVRKIALEEIEKTGLPPRILFDVAERKTEELAEKLGADKTIALVGYCLMDLKLGKAAEEGKLEEHVEMSSQAAKEFLEKFDLDEKTKNKIINCVEAHHGAVPFACKEAEICANADVYKFIHPKAFFAFMMTLGKREMGFDEALDYAEFKLDEKYKILSLDICKKELEPFYRHLKELVRTAREF
ncbi:MAG: hypothetical protein JSV92_02135 [archaeon]|nr:MAG: hypothetical protein JSV92_02135 [archaeon]